MQKGDFKITVRSRKQSPDSRQHTLTIPASVAANLPEHSEWEMTVLTETLEDGRTVSRGYALTFKGEYVPAKGRQANPTLVDEYVAS